MVKWIAMNAPHSVHSVNTGSSVGLVAPGTGIRLDKPDFTHLIDVPGHSTEDVPAMAVTCDRLDRFVGHLFSVFLDRAIVDSLLSLGI